MDVERELAAVRRRVRAQIDRNARAALVRIGIDVEAEERAAREALELERRRAADASAEQLGASLRAMRDSWVRMAEGIARGFNGGGVR